MRIFGHPAHAALVHVPIALCSVSPLWDVIGLWTSEALWTRFAYWSLLFGLIGSVPAIATGFLDFVRLPPHENIEAMAFRHLVIMFVALALFVVGLMIRGGVLPVSPTRHWIHLGFAAVGTGALFAGAWYGGELVFRYGVGRIGDREAVQDPGDDKTE